MKFTKAIHKWKENGNISNCGYQFKEGAERHFGDEALKSRPNYLGEICNLISEFSEGFDDIMIGEDGKTYAVMFGVESEGCKPLIWQEVEKALSFAETVSSGDDGSSLESRGYKINFYSELKVEKNHIDCHEKFDDEKWEDFYTGPIDVKQGSDGKLYGVLTYADGITAWQEVKKI